MQRYTDQVHPLHADEVHIWQVSLEATADPVEQQHQLLDADERARAVRFHFPKDRRKYIIARATLRRLLAGYLQCEPTTLRFVYSKYGKPALAPPLDSKSLSFNLSHAGELALYAFTLKSTVGIDIEQIRGNLEYEAMARQVFSAYEQQHFFVLPAEERLAAFFNGWTRKEAYIKALGEGLSHPLDQFDVTMAAGEPARLLATRPDPAEVARWSLHAWLPADGYAAALAVPGSTQCQIRFFPNSL